ncbi:MAG: hypothetical protein U0350_07155 [Caldilineaceae bacterium]
MSTADYNDADYEVSTISEGSYVGAYEHLQAISAEYYNITDVESWPIAGLLVLLDSQRQPVRAELHLYEDLPDDVREAALRQGRLLLEKRYFSTDLVPLRVMKSYQWRDTFQVEANGALAPIQEIPWFKRWETAAAAGAVVLLIFVIWALASLLRSPAKTTASNVANAPAAQPAGVAKAVSVAAMIPPTVTLQEFATYPQTNNLPASSHARNDLKIGQRVRVPNGLALTLRSAPGADAGSQMGFLKNTEEATIVNGPVWTAGDSDTIVWWLVSLDNGSKAWAPANTSNLILLEPTS